MMNRNTILKALFVVAFAGTVASCNDFLDKEPMSSIDPELYLKEETQLSFYANNLYTDILPSHTKNYSYGIFGEDVDTDNQAGASAHERYATGLLKVPQKEDNDWKFEMIYKCNWFLNEVLPRFGENLDGSANTIGGSLAHVKHYIGEVYFLRACEYFKRYQLFGDFPIITEPLLDDMAALTEASKRSPRNEVARFILSDLEKAATLLGAVNLKKTRITREAALLLQSRVALYEGTWLKYFKGTAFVPQGEGWPGSTKAYNADYAFPTGSIDAEIDYFLGISMKAAAEVGDMYLSQLTENTGKVPQSADEPINPYLDMFGQEDLEAIPEVLLWRQYARGISTHNVPVYATTGNQRIGITRGLVESFLMADGTPIYARQGYKDATIADVRTDRDSRLFIFLKEPGQKNILIENIEGTQAKMVEPYPAITDGNSETGYTTGYALRKGGSFNQKFHSNGGGFTGAICYRATEALLNYMEASYEKTGSLDGKARSYWTQIRKRSLVSTDLENTFATTRISEEAKNDWGAYSGGRMLTDPILYNIRRERRCELMAEGLRFMDLCRWRAMDQLMTEKYHIEGFHLWNTPMEHWYDDPTTGKTTLRSDGTPDATVSAKALSEYLRPFEKSTNQTCYDGCTWHLAHYLKPVMIKQFLITSPDGKTVEQSTIYQNPYWPMVADKPAEK